MNLEFSRFLTKYQGYKFNKKDMKPFYIDSELEHPILFYNVLPCFRTSYSVLGHYTKR